MLEALRELAGITISRIGRAGRLQGVTSKPPFETIVATHGVTVLRVCRAILSPEDADDAWSETFVAAMKAYPDLPGDANVQAWLVTIAHRKAIDVTRAVARRARLDADLPAAGLAPAADHRDLDLAASLARLPLRQKQAVAYHYLAGLSYGDVAAILGGTTEAARRAAADGIANLRRTYPGVTARNGELQ